MSALVRQLPWHFRALSMSVLVNQATSPVKIQSRRSCSSIPPYSLGYKQVTCPPRFKWTRTRVFLLMEDRQNSRNSLGGEVLFLPFWKMKTASMWRLLLPWLLKCYLFLPQTFPTSGGIISHVPASAKTRRCWIDGWLFSSFLNKSYTTLIVSSLLTFFSFSYNILMSRIICHLQIQYTKYLTTAMFRNQPIRMDIGDPLWGSRC